MANQSDLVIDRCPPHSPEAEMGILGCILIDEDMRMREPNDRRGCLDECIQRINAPDFFYDLRHQTIFDVMVEMRDKRAPIDMITLCTTLKDKKVLEQVGGWGFLSVLPDQTPSSINLPYYLDIAYEKFLARRMIRLHTQAVGVIFENGKPIEKLIDEVERDIRNVRALQVQPKTADMKELVSRNIQMIEDYIEKRQQPGLSTGFVDLDKVTLGMWKEDMIVIAARPGMGKSSLVMNIVDHVAVEQARPVSVFSYEMTAEKISMRMMCSRARVNFRSVVDGFVRERDLPKLAVASGKLSKAPIHIDDRRDKSLVRFRAEARRHKRVYGSELFVVDYLQLMHDREGHHKSREQEITAISVTMKDIATELKVPLIVISAMNRDSEREKRRPRMSDLRESGAIEQDADVIGMLYYPKTEEDYRGSEAVPTNLLITKQRDGQSDVDVNFTFLKIFTRFELAAKIRDEDVPEQETMDYTR